jgi:cob(I)alamin adenosyltransferase
MRHRARAAERTAPRFVRFSLTRDRVTRYLNQISIYLEYLGLHGGIEHGASRRVMKPGLIK